MLAAGGCLTCDPSLLMNSHDRPLLAWPARLFTPPTPFGGTCPTSCVANTVWELGSCVHCSLLYPSPPPDARFCSLWNASNGLRWWPAQYDPPHLGPRTGLPEVRAGKCWPCPDTLPDLPDAGYTDLCVMQAPTRVTGRRLLSIQPVECAANHYYAMGACVACPAFSHSPPYSTSVLSCSCQAGFQAANGGCMQCPEGSENVGASCVACGRHRYSAMGQCRECPIYSNISGCTSTVEPPCPANQLRVSGKCLCGPGFEMVEEGACTPCTKGAFSSYAGEAPCTRCPSGTTTAQTRSIRMAQCA